MKDASTVWKFDAWVKFSEGGGGHRTCYVGHADQAAARELLLRSYPGSRMDGAAVLVPPDEASALMSRAFKEGEVYLVN